MGPKSQPKWSPNRPWSLACFTSLIIASTSFGPTKAISYSFPSVTQALRPNMHGFPFFTLPFACTSPSPTNFQQTIPQATSSCLLARQPMPKLAVSKPSTFSMQPLARPSLNDNHPKITHASRSPCFLALSQLMTA